MPSLTTSGWFLLTAARPRRSWRSSGSRSWRWRLCSDSVWAVAAGTARAWFARDPRRLRRLTGLGGTMMIGLGGVLLGADNHA